MFTTADREHLIQELNKQLDNGEFYQASTTHGMADISAIKKEKVPSKSTGVSPYSISHFEGVGLYRPLVVSDFNPFKSKIYHYPGNYQIPIHGIAFATPEPKEAKETAKQEPENLCVAVPKVAEDTYCMADILPETANENMIQWAKVPKERALAKRNPVREILWKQIDLASAWQKVFGIHK